MVKTFSTSPSKYQFAKVESAFLKLYDYITKNEWSGSDPFDGLNSPVLKTVFGGNRYSAIVIVQLFKRSPVNLRKLFRVQERINAKGVGLYLAGLCRLYNTSYWDEHQAQQAADWLLEHRTNQTGYAAWGYPFDWPNRGFYAPAGTPTVVNTVFIGHALLDYYRVTGSTKYLDTAQSSGYFIIRDLNRFEQNDSFCFSYTPQDNRYIHNANLLAAGYLARLYRFAGNKDFFEPAARSVRFSVKAQSPDGRWPYGIARRDSWVDHFHTVFNLLSLKYFVESIELSEAQQAFKIGSDYYFNQFFDGFLPKFYPDKLFPIDSHSVANAIIALLHLEPPVALGDKIENLLAWSISRMQAPNGGFYYQKNRYYMNKILYMRWSQMWMFLALASYLSKNYQNGLLSHD